MRIIRSNDDWAEWEEKRAAIFPGSLFGTPNHIQRGWLEEFEEALTKGSEEEIQCCIEARPYLARYVMPSTGHHGVWLFPKQMIQARRPNGERGLIPDFLAVASNSDGYTWWVIELKRADEHFVNSRGDALTTMGNKALLQCAAYLDQLDNYVDMVRSLMGVPQLGSPKGAVLLIGDSRNENEDQKTSRRRFNNALGHRMHVMSYSRILDGLQSDMMAFRGG